jgi:FlaG/FlaF family flagellin (archaellin)
MEAHLMAQICDSPIFGATLLIVALVVILAGILYGIANGDATGSD